MDDKLNIKLMIADAYYPLKIERKEEEIVRKAANQINDKLNKYRAHFPNLPLEKYLVMIALDISTEKLRQENKNDTGPYTEKLKELTKELEDYFREE